MKRNKNKEIDEIDKCLYEYFKNEPVEEIPEDIQKSFNKTIEKIKKSK